LEVPVATQPPADDVKSPDFGGVHARSPGDRSDPRVIDRESPPAPSFLPAFIAKSTTNHGSSFAFRRRNGVALLQR